MGFLDGLGRIASEKVKAIKKITKEKSEEAGKLMTKSEFSECNKIIHTASAGCAAFAAIPIPVADAIPITALQVTMILGLGRVFGKEIDSAIAKTLLAAVAAPLVGRFAAKNTLILIPFAGWAANAAIAASVTEAVGWSIAITFAAEKKRLEKQEDFEAFDSDFDDEDAEDFEYDNATIDSDDDTERAKHNESSEVDKDEI